MNTHVLISLYGGPLDGGEIEANEKATVFHLPVKEQPTAIYRVSGAWSAHLGKRVAVHDSFPGMPPPPAPTSTYRSMSKPKAITQPLENPEVAACAARFRALHGALRQSVLGVKLLKYFLGLEASRLYELHAELYGETRGRPGDGENNGTRSVISLEPWLEERLGVTARSARKYRDFFNDLTVTNAYETTVKKLNAWWADWKEKTTPMLEAAPAKKGGKQALSLKDNATAALALHDGCKLDESDLQTILDHPDEWGLHGLFAEPIKDVTPAGDDDDSDDGPKPSDNKQKLILFWHRQLGARLARNEFLKLPKPQLEALGTELEEALHKIKDRLKTAAPKKKGARA